MAVSSCSHLKPCRFRAVDTSVTFPARRVDRRHGLLGGFGWRRQSIHGGSNWPECPSCRYTYIPGLQGDGKPAALPRFSEPPCGTGQLAQALEK